MYRIHLTTLERRSNDLHSQKCKKSKTEEQFRLAALILCRISPQV